MENSKRNNTVKESQINIRDEDYERTQIFFDKKIKGAEKIKNKKEKNKKENRNFNDDIE